MRTEVYRNYGGSGRVQTNQSTANTLVAAIVFNHGANSPATNG